MPDRKSAITTKPSRVRTTSTLSSPTSVTSARSRSSSRSPVRYVTDETLGKDEPINTASSNPDSPFHATTDEEEEEQQQLIDTAKEVTKKNVGGNNKRRASTAPSQSSKRPRKASTSPPDSAKPEKMDVEDNDDSSDSSDEEDEKPAATKETKTAAAKKEVSQHFSFCCRISLTICFAQLFYSHFLAYQEKTQNHLKTKAFQRQKNPWNHTSTSWNTTLPRDY